ncbi:hypothetical protein SAMN05519104_3730 [Rhizobiales bacterium GAS188]|nr:hypothetical protein SAMN05519104_3730 [Rhizobiales bacterium GAS188]
MAGLVPVIHAFLNQKQDKTWMTGPSPVMTCLSVGDRRADPQ